MAFTDHCDIFASFHEDGFNRIIEHIRLQRPSMFNYATEAVANNPQLLCRPIDAHPRLTQHGNPLVTIVDPLPLPGTHFAINFAVQLVDVKVDIHPGNTINLPSELAPLAEQRLAIGLTVCAGLGCPSADTVEQMIPPPPKPGEDPPPPPKDPVVLPTDRLQCICLSASAAGGLRFREYWQQWYLEPFVDQIEITDISPENLEGGIECLIITTLRLGFLPKLRILLEKMTLDIIDDISVDVQPKPAVSPQIPNNPALEGDEVKAFIDVEVS